METKRTEQIEYRYSTGFWLSKVLYVLLAALLAWLIWWLLTYKDNTVEVVKEEPQQVVEVQEQVQPEEPVVEEPVAVAPVSPFSIMLPSGLEEPEKKPNSSVYTYQLNDEAELTISLDGGSEKDADLRWTHDLQATGEKLNLVSKSEQLCVAGTTGCSAGNGLLEISVTRDVDSYKAVRFDIVDSAPSHEAEDARELYEAVLESFMLNTEGEE